MKYIGIQRFVRKLFLICSNFKRHHLSSCKLILAINITSPMSDYMYYLDLEAIECADIAFAKKQYNLSTLLYGIAHRRLMKYRGDRMAPIQMAGSLKEKLQDSERAWTANPHQRPLTYSSWKLSKTSFVKGKQCLKFLYLDKYKKDQKTQPSPETKELFKKGREFEASVRKKMFSNGIDVSKGMASKFGYFFSYTNELLRNNSAITLFEATVIVDSILVMVDMLNKDNDGNLDFYEIKLNSTLTEGILWDLSLQYYVVKKRFGNKVRSFNVVLRVGEEDWQVIDVKDRLEGLIEKTGDTGREYLQLLESNIEPEIAIGKHCDLPYKCDFKEYCAKAPRPLIQP